MTLPADPQVAMSRCIHCAADLTKVPMVGWVHPNGKQGVVLPSGDIDHLAMPVGGVRGLPQHLGLLPR